MTISTNPERSDVFCKDVIKPLIENVFTALYTNSVFTRIINELMPRGFDVKQFGRISSKTIPLYKPNRHYNSTDGIYCFGRTMPTQDEITIRLRLFRKKGWNHTQSANVSHGYTFSDEFFLQIEFIDERIVRQNMIRGMLGTTLYATQTLQYNQNDHFESFVLKTLVNDFNNNYTEIENRFEEHQNKIRGIHAATAKRY